MSEQICLHPFQKLEMKDCDTWWDSGDTKETVVTFQCSDCGTVFEKTWWWKPNDL